MKKFWFAGVSALVLMTVPAAAADMRVRPVYKAPPPVAYGYNWTGCYVGGFGGGLWARKEWTLQPPDAVVALGSHDADSWLAGAQVGCDYQFAPIPIVIGIRGDYAWTDAKGSHVDIIDGTIDRTRVRDLATVTARAGFAWDRFLGYVKGGVAWERDDYDRVLIGTNDLVGRADERRTGWTVGVGGEYAFTNWLSAFVEYNYYDFGNRTLTFVTPAGAFNDNIDIHERKSVVKAGLNFRWGWAGPVVARY
jgi:outer membrane immunogenic protein